MNDLLPFLLFSFSTLMTPGPNNFMLMNSGLKFGIKKSLPHYLGICLGFPLMVLIVSLGFGEIFQKYVWLKISLKILGSAYMLYLAWQILFSTSNPKSEKVAKPLSFFQAVMFQWVNPKAWLMAIGAISIFSLMANSIYNAIAISSIFLLIGLPCIGSWLLFGASLQRFIKNERHQKWFNRVMAVCLIASIAMVIID